MKTKTTPKKNRDLSLRFKVTREELAQIRGCSVLEKKTMSNYIRTNLNL